MSTRLDDENIQNQITPKNIGNKITQTYKPYKNGELEEEEDDTNKWRPIEKWGDRENGKTSIFKFFHQNKCKISYNKILYTDLGVLLKAKTNL